MRKLAQFRVSAVCEKCKATAGMTVPAHTRRVLMRARGRGAVVYLPCRSPGCRRDVPVRRLDFDQATVVPDTALV